jgi:hypothetical protein
MKNWQEVIKAPTVEGLKDYVRLEVRNIDEVKAIAQRASALTCEDPVWTGRFLRMVELILYSKTWGSELVISDKDTGLIESGVVLAELDRIARLKNGAWRAEVVARVFEAIMLFPFDTPLYLAMAQDLGGRAALNEIQTKIMTLGLIIPAKVAEKARGEYEKMAGLAYWQIGPEQIYWSFSLCYMLLKMNTDELVELWEETPDEEIDYEVGSRTDEILVRTRARARELAKVILGRGLIGEDEFISCDDEGGKITYRDLLEILN